MSFFIVSNSWNLGTLSLHCSAELLKTNSGWNKGGPSSVTSGHLHPGLPWRPAAHAWHHGSKTIMRRLAWVEHKSSLAKLFPPLLLFSCPISFHIHRLLLFNTSLCLSVIWLLSCLICSSLFSKLCFSSLACRDSFPRFICISKGAGDSLYQHEELSRVAAWILKRSSIVSGACSQPDR